MGEFHEGDIKKELSRLYQYQRASDRIIASALAALKNLEECLSITTQGANILRDILTEPLGEKKK
jgi:hypothetical protein